MEHGPLIEISYNTTTHGMMMGSGSSNTDAVRWCRDGSVILNATIFSGGKNLRSEYRLTPEMAQKVRDFVADEKIAEQAEKKVELPVMFDCFTSASITMIFDDSAVGGSPYEHVFLNCGPSRMAFRQLEEAVSELLKECRETGEYTGGETTDNNGQNIFGGFMGFPGINGIPGFHELKAEENDKQGRSGAATADTTSLIWTCPCGFTENRGKFCPNCGQPRPAQ